MHIGVRGSAPFAVARNLAGNDTGLPVTLTVTAPGYFNFPGIQTVVLQPGATTELWSGAAGPATITAIQTGSKDYAPVAAVTQNIVFGKAPLDVTANGFIREAGAFNPALKYTVGCQLPTPGCFVNGDLDMPNVVTGAPTITTAAGIDSAAGSYPVAVSQGTLAASNYYFVFKNGVATITPPGTFTITATSSTVTLQAGQNIQTTMTLTPVNFYQGTVTLSCGQVPANVSCIFTPASYVFPGADFNLQYANPSEAPISGTLTANTLSGSPVAGSLSTPSPRGPLSPIAAGIFLLPGSAGGVLLFFTRRRTLRRLRSHAWLLVAASLASAACLLSSCGSHSAAGNSLTAAPGTYTVVVQDTGTTPSGTPSGSSTVTASMNLKMIVE